MTFGFVEIHTCISCNAAAINMSNIVQYLLCNAYNNYVLVLQQIKWLHELHFYVPSNKKAKACYWADRGYVLMATSSEKVHMWIPYYTIQDVDVNIYVCLFLNCVPLSQEYNFLRL